MNKTAQQIIASQTKVAAEALSLMKAAAAADQLDAAAAEAERLIAASDAAEAAAEAAGIELTDEQYAALGYVSPEPEEGAGFIMLDIPTPVGAILAARSRAKKIAEIAAAEAIAKSEDRQLTEEELTSLGYWHDGNNVWRVLDAPEKTVTLRR